MRIATFNVNSIRKRLPHLRRFLERHTPDLVFLQETRCQVAEFPTEGLAELGYRAHAVGQPGGRNGVAVVARVPFAVVAEALPGDPEDAQARYVEVEVAGGTRLAGLYLPNGNSGGEDGYASKLRWMDRLAAHAAEHLDGFRPLALLGDFNVCPTPADHAGPMPPTDALVRPETRAAFRRLQHLGLTDALRALHPADASYTYWDYGPAFEANRGLRIDHVLLSPELADRLEGCGVDTDTRAEEQPSDHAPVWCDLA